MHLSDVLNSDMVWSDLAATAKKDVIRELAHRISETDTKIEEDAVFKVLWDRENLGSTGIECGVAIPHAKVPNLDRIVLACAKSAKGLDFDAHDSKPTHLFFVLLAPSNATGMHLKVLARISRLLKESKFRAKLIEAKSPEDMYRIIVEEDKNI